MARPRGAGPKVGLALAGGGPGGAAYELGAILALEEALDPLDLTALDVYVGVSAGAFIAACLANRVRPAQLVRGLIDAEPGLPRFSAEVLFTPAYAEFARRGARLPRLLGEVLWRMASRRDVREAIRSITRFAHALPVGLFDGDPLRRYLHEVFSTGGRTDDFRELERPLVVVATDLRTAKAVRFGEAGWDHVPISLAVQASAALPGLYAPVLVDGRACVDGVLLKTLHASVALERGTRLLLCVNPIVPVDASSAAAAAGLGEDTPIVRGSVTTVLSQTFRTLVHSRMEVGMAGYATRYPGADVLLFEPRRDEYGMFFANIFAFETRKTLCELGYDATRRDLRARRAELAAVFQRHGLTIHDDVLDDGARSVWDAAGVRPPSRTRRDGALHRRLDELDDAIADAERGRGERRR